eukprot:TRINITY_DN43299_c0_g1_i1.p1 TRINITY_DN43299_c0_g1~~TRINITY_DN43299_c0_g1_i1.p1  ORF type:complete len:1238 (-),score=181.85 TRINITY_DN43299_c0_g1_i1:336-3956(-)
MTAASLSLSSKAPPLAVASPTVVEAASLLIHAVRRWGSSFSERFRRLRRGIIAFVLVWVVTKVLRWRVNANWSREHRSPKAARRVSNAGLYDDVVSDTESEDGDEPLSRLAHLQDAPRRVVSDRALGLARGGLPSDDKRTILAQCGALAGLDHKPLCFLLERAKVLCFRPGEVIFEKGGPRDVFLVVHSGQVLVKETSAGARATVASRRDGECILGPGNIAVGLLFILAGLDARGGDSDPSVSSATACHQGTARAGSDGAEIVALPTKALGEAFDVFPQAMRSLSRLLCTRLTLVVWETLSNYFGLRQELMIREREQTMLLNLGSTPLSSVLPEQVFSCILGRDGDREDVKAVLAAATVLDCAAGEIVQLPQQRAPHLLVLLEGKLWVELPMAIADGSPRRGSAMGEVAATATQLTTEAASSATEMPLGSLVGELSIFTDRPDPLVYRCGSPCRFAALPRGSVHRLLQLVPRAFCLRILQSVTDKSPEWLQRVDAAMDWIHVESGRSLYKKGDPMNGFFVVLSGRLLELEETESSAEKTPWTNGTLCDRRTQWRVVRTLRRGMLCGELDCLRGMPEHSATVRASRDTEMCRVSPAVLQFLAMDFPQSILRFSATIAQKVQAPVPTSDDLQGIVTIAVVPADESVEVHEVCVQLTLALRQLGKTTHVSPDSDLSGLSGTDAARNLDRSRFGRLLVELEDRCRWLVYEAEPGVTEWTRRCVRQADLILIAVRFDCRSRGEVRPTIVEQYVDEFVRRGHTVGRELLLVHDFSEDDESQDGLVTKLRSSPRLRTHSLATNYFAPDCSADNRQPGLRGFVAEGLRRGLFGGTGGGRRRSTRHYLSPRSWARRWHHVRTGQFCDWQRCARLLVGQGIGLCLGGGGARGNVAFGVVRALEELGIPIDVVAGTSFGALAGGMYAMTAAEPQGTLAKVVDRVMSRVFSTRRMLMDLSYPRTALFTGWYLNNVLQRTFTRRRCEDMLVPFVCTSTDILKLEAKSHDEGLMWRICRASMSLVGFVPPLPYEENQTEDGTIDKSLLVDGGYTNQYPIELLRQRGASIVILVQACPDFDAIGTGYGDRVEGGAISLLRFFRVAWRWYNGPDPPAQAEIQERLMYLPDAVKGKTGSAADLWLKPPVGGFGLLEFARYKELIEIGYHNAMPAISEWLSGDSEAADRVRRMIPKKKLQEKPSAFEETHTGQLSLRKVMSFPG